tara:strand:+ start:1347 stop:2495 length:1149 start_codon:yes stop_codon:yes gene_type:complete
MNRPIPYGRQNIDQKDIDSVVDTLNSDYLTQGPKVKQFEKKFADYVKSKYAVSVSSATAGLHLSAIALSTSKGDRVITTPISFAATSNCIRYCQGEVWFADIDPDNFNLSLNETKKLIESKPKGFFKGIIPVNFGGLSVDLEAFRNLANEHDLWIIEDASHSPGAHYIDSKGNKQRSGNCKYSDLSVFSFHPVKHIACGEGGMVTTNSKILYDRISTLKTHGISKDNMIENHGDWYYEMTELGFNYRLTDIQCALGITQLKKNNDGVIRRNEIANRYKNAFKGKIKFQETPLHFYHAYHLFVILVEDRKGLYDFLKSKLIYTQIHYIPIHQLPYYRKIGYEGAFLTNAENYYNHCLSLPMFPSLKNSEQDYIIKMVLEYVDR